MTPGAGRGADLPVPDEALRHALALYEAGVMEDGLNPLGWARAIAGPVVAAELRRQVERIECDIDTHVGTGTAATDARFIAGMQLRARADQIDPAGARTEEST